MNAVNNVSLNDAPPVSVPEANEGKNYRYLLDEPVVDTVNFRGDEYNPAGKRKSKVLGATLGILMTAAAVFVGLGYLGKYNTKVVKALKDKNHNKIADFVTRKADGGVINFCQKGCKTVKGWGVDAWNWTKGIFEKKS